jgi:hypothetical protein
VQSLPGAGQARAHILDAIYITEHQLGVNSPEDDKPPDPVVVRNLQHDLRSSELPVPHFSCAVKRRWSTAGETRFIFFIDWDRCKTARKDIVYAFVNSAWPPSDLIRAVEPTGDIGLIFNNLLQERTGESFLAALRRDVRSIPIRERKKLQATIDIGLNAHGGNQEDSGNSE